MKYYIARDGQPVGPYSLEELRNQRISSDTLLWNESLSRWTPAGEISEVRSYALSVSYNTHSTGRSEGYRQQPRQQPQYQQPQYQQPQYQQPQYQQPQYQQPQYQNQMSRPVCPKTWLTESILATLFCCLPFGIVGIVHASGVSAKYSRGDYEGALQASKDAGKWTKISFFLGLISAFLYFIYFIFMFVLQIALL